MTDVLLGYSFICHQCGAEFHRQKNTPRKYCCHACYSDAIRGVPLKPKPTCTVDDCGRGAVARGYCTLHYGRWAQWGNPLKVHEFPTFEERFWAFVNKAGPILLPDLGPCWVWTGATRNGYGAIHYGSGGHAVAATRASYYLAHGEWPQQGIQVCHECDNPPCVRPDHLFLGTNLDNIADKIAKGRQRSAAEYWRSHPERTPPSAKLTTEQVFAIRERYTSEQISKAALGREYGVTGENIAYVLNRATWKQAPVGAL